MAAPKLVFEAGQTTFERPTPTSSFFRLSFVNAYVTSEEGEVEPAGLTMTVTMPGSPADQEMTFAAGAPAGWSRGSQGATGFVGTYEYLQPFAPEDQARLDGAYVSSTYEPIMGRPLRLLFEADGFEAVEHLFVVPFPEAASFTVTNKLEVLDPEAPYLTGNGTAVVLDGTVDWANQFRFRAEIAFTPDAGLEGPVPMRLEQPEAWVWLDQTEGYEIQMTGPVTLQYELVLSDGLTIVMGDDLLSTLPDTPAGTFTVTLKLVDIIEDRVVQSTVLTPVSQA
ncbi:hypothetical protein [Nocardioides daphniae]|uniref:Uncharacterized protein n=1 Tax=Nocardioides daphniae TaxID=402297 RepID=A0A4P7UGY5_9ACTN|nr:hypothetical protein [Nocardioides daphniae]QCC77959.1 hypothetical protein E2C04_13610 [Nocardioides daphniae]